VRLISGGIRGGEVNVWGIRGGEVNVWGIRGGEVNVWGIRGDEVKNVGQGDGHEKAGKVI